MALIVEDGTGLATAESYASVAFADAYHTAYGNPADWSGASTADKEIGLRIATQYLDARYNGCWLGLRSNKLQALDWPRRNVVDPDGFVLDDDDLPLELEQATAILALKHVQGTELLPDQQTSGDIKREAVKVGTIEEDITYFGAGSQLKTFPLVEKMLRHLVQSNAVGVLERS